MNKQPQTPSVVPFGKYKGQPVEVLAQDRPYLEWLSAQDWFRERYSGIYTLIINNFTEATETPDHNALQVLFLDDEFCERFATVLEAQWRNRCLQRLATDLQKEVARLNQEIERPLHAITRYAEEERKFGWDARRTEWMNQHIEQAKQIEQRIHETKILEWRLSFSREFERDGIDVRLYASIGSNNFWATVVSTNIEIKPTVGDDYPAVLRQMRANNSGVLFTNNYSGVGATEDQFIKTFAASKMRVVFRRDVDAVQITDKPRGRIVL